MQNADKGLSSISAQAAHAVMWWGDWIISAALIHSTCLLKLVPMSTLVQCLFMILHKSGRPCSVSLCEFRDVILHLTRQSKGTTNQAFHIVCCLVFMIVLCKGLQNRRGVIAVRDLAFFLSRSCLLDDCKIRLYLVLCHKYLRNLVWGYKIFSI